MTASADSPVPTPAVGHVCVGSPSSRKPTLCWICGQFLPHDCVGGAQPTADRLDGFALLPDAQTTHGPPRGVDDDALCGCSLPPHTIAQCVVRGAKRLTVAGRKWPIGTSYAEQATFQSNLKIPFKASYHWGERLVAARTHRGLTLDALGAKLDPPRTRKDISAMEHGRRGLSVELCAQLADALDCDRLWLAGWTL